MGEQTDTFHYIAYSPESMLTMQGWHGLSCSAVNVFQYLDATYPKSRQRIEGAWKLRIGNLKTTFEAKT